MKKFLLLSLIIFIFTTGFKFPYPFRCGIIFNKVPFTRETAETYTRVFNRGERIYWLFMSKRPIKAQFIKVQIFQVNDRGPWNTITGIVYTHDYRINIDSPHFFTDYVVLHSPGHYYMEIFDHNNLFRPMTTADFYVR